jgi:hypothetical protein
MMGMPITPHPADQIVANIVTVAKAIRAAAGVVCLSQTPDLLTAPRHLSQLKDAGWKSTSNADDGDIVAHQPIVAHSKMEKCVNDLPRRIVTELARNL